MFIPIPALSQSHSDSELGFERPSWPPAPSAPSSRADDLHSSPCPTFSASHQQPSNEPEQSREPRHTCSLHTLASLALGLRSQLTATRLLRFRASSLS